MLLQSYLNECCLSKLAKIDKLYINSASTRLLQRSKIGFIEYKNQIFPNDSHIHLRAFDSVSSYHFTYPITVSKITKWDCILYFCYYCPGTNATDLQSS